MKNKCLMFKYLDGVVEEIGEDNVVSAEERNICKEKGKRNGET